MPYHKVAMNITVTKPLLQVVNTASKKNPWNTTTMMMAAEIHSALEDLIAI